MATAEEMAELASEEYLDNSPWAQEQRALWYGRRVLGVKSEPDPREPDGLDYILDRVDDYQIAKRFGVRRQGDGGSWGDEDQTDASPPPRRKSKRRRTSRGRGAREDYEWDGSVAAAGVKVKREVKVKQEPED